MSSIAEAAPAVKASPRSRRAASASTTRPSAGRAVDTLTGNYESDQYESDQVHVRDILGRLAQRRDGGGSALGSSAWRAYAVEVEADGRRMFYSGDLRAHGRRSTLFERMGTHPPKDIDVMLMEGSSLGRLPDDGMVETEDDLERFFADRLEKTAGMALVACSAQNIDRVVTVYHEAHRTLIVDAYAAEVLKATGYDSIPKPAQGWPNIAVCIPQSQRVSLKRKGIAPIA